MPATERFTSSQIKAIDELFTATWKAVQLRPTLVSCRPDGSLVCYEVPRVNNPRPSFVWIDAAGKVTRDDS